MEPILLKLTKTRIIKLLQLLVLVFVMIGFFFNFQYLISTSSGPTGTEFSHLITQPYSSSASSVHHIVMFLGANASLDSGGQLSEENRIPKNRIILQDAITQNPGITLREIQRETNLALGVIQYHLRYLESREVTIESIKLGRCKHFFERSLSYSVREKLWLALTRNPKIGPILVHITENNGLCLQKDLASVTGHSRALVSYYVKNLRKQGLIKVDENRLQIAEEFLAYCHLATLRD